MPEERRLCPGIAAAIVAAAIAVALALALALARRGDEEDARCGPGFVVHGARCVAPDTACPAPLAATPHGCDAPDVRILVPAASVLVGPSDWEAEGRVRPRRVHADAFRIDAFEVTLGRYATGNAWGGRHATGARDRLATRELAHGVADPARAVSGVTRTDAAAFCARSGGRLPTEDEWIIAAASATDPPRRYPWGDTGAVCRRGAWGLLAGPCATSGDGPDTAGAHGAGDSPLGLHDMAGNVAEWVAPDPDPDLPAAARIGVAKGGSWQTRLASELRIWARLELPADASDARVGFRCVYPP